jgi:hypothetical protein
VDLSFASLKDQGRDRFGIVPPDFLGNGFEELEGGDHAFEDRLGTLERECPNEGIIRVGPGGDQEGDLPSSVGEVDVDVAEVGFEALAGEMNQGYEGFLISALMLEQVALHLAVTPAVAVFVAQPTEHLHGGVALLGGRVLVVGQNLVDNGLKRS